jgi:broad specificity phosphatase PhoE
MRHGETLYLGQASEDGTDLTPNGRRQIETVAETFRTIPLDVVLASPMRRSRGTAGLVAAPHGLAVEVAPDLREIQPGITDGMLLSDIFAQVLDFFSSPDVTWDTPFVAGETFRALHERTQAFVRALLARPGWTNALAVAHGGANMALLAGVLGLSEGEIPRLEQDLGCVNVIDFDASGRGVVRLLNHSVEDPLKAALREPSSARLRRVLESRADDLRGIRWQSGFGDPEV